MQKQTLERLRWWVLSAAALAATALWAAEPTVPATQAGTAKPESSKPQDAAKPGAAAAQAAKPDTKPDAAKPADPAKPDAKPAAAATAEAAKPDKEKTGSEKASPQRFIPSEQVRADFDVSFPIDI